MAQPIPPRLPETRWDTASIAADWRGDTFVCLLVRALAADPAAGVTEAALSVLQGLLGVPLAVVPALLARGAVQWSDGFAPDDADDEENDE